MKLQAAFLLAVAALAKACDHHHQHQQQQQQDRNLRARPNLPDQVPEFVNDIVFNGPDGKPKVGTRCGVPKDQEDNNGNHARMLLSIVRDEDLRRKLAWTLNIPIKFHVIYSDNNVGNVPQSMIDNQITMMNESFQGSGLTFTLHETIRHYDPVAYTACYDTQQFKYDYAIDTATYFNVYSCRPKDGSILGYAYYPSSFAESDPRHGVVILDQSMPGGSASPYNEGDVSIISHGRAKSFLVYTHTCLCISYYLYY